MDCASENTLAIQYNYGSNRTELQELLNSLPNLKRIAIIFDTLNLS